MDKSRKCAEWRHNTQTYSLIMSTWNSKTDKTKLEHLEIDLGGRNVFFIFLKQENYKHKSQANGSFRGKR